MSDEEKDLKREHAKLKRLAVEIASEIHDIVEDTLWTNYVNMPALAEKLKIAVQEANDFKDQHNL
ncbi:hypothetical protein KKC15_12445 [bacterium]|nr:hypothetical protein [bacterium]